jgi:CHAD domain-containing protein
MAETGTPPKSERGIGYWMERVVAERDKALKNFDADAVHDLRTALRRCRSIAEGFQSLDGRPSWKKMRKAGKAVFSALGDLRDTQVLLEWIDRLKNDCPPVAERLRTHCLQREAELKETVAAVVNDFNTRRWLQWASQLERRVQALNEPVQVFEVLALERYDSSRALHSRALRNRNKAALHQLRIGIKKFRYIVENFLPQHHEKWGKDLKQLQDLLGEVHDLDVLVDTARRLHAFATPQERQQFLSAVSREREQRVQSYRTNMVGSNSLWHEWRLELPAGEALERAVLKRFEVWAATLDPDLRHTHKVTQFSLQVFDALSAAGLISWRDGRTGRLRNLLQVAAITHEVGRTRRTKSHHKISWRLLQKLEAPPGWSRQDLVMAGLVARYHCGALPDAQRSYAALPPDDRRGVDYLSGVLRLADSLDCRHDNAISRIQVTPANGVVEIVADGYRARGKQATQIAAARHLLEDVTATPVIVRGSYPGLSQMAPSDSAAADFRTL